MSETQILHRCFSIFFVTHKTSPLEAMVQHLNKVKLPIAKNAGSTAAKSSVILGLVW